MEFWVKIITLFIPISRIRKNVRKKLYKYFYERPIYKIAKQVGKNLYVNGKSEVTKYTILGDNVSFNGMNIQGNGNVKIGNYFHSGIE